VAGVSDQWLFVMDRIRCGAPIVSKRHIDNVATVSESAGLHAGTVGRPGDYSVVNRLP
jgi:hypothetical protein